MTLGLPPPPSFDADGLGCNCPVVIGYFHENIAKDWELQSLRHKYDFLLATVQHLPDDKEKCQKTGLPLYGP